MKNIQGYLIIGFFIFKTNNVNNHCYNKVYNEFKDMSEDRAAVRAIYECGLHPGKK